MKYAKVKGIVTKDGDVIARGDAIAYVIGNF